MFASLRFAGVIALGLGMFGMALLPSEAGEYRGSEQNFIHRGMHGTGFGYHHADRGRIADRNRMPGAYRFPAPGRGLDITENRTRFDAHRAPRPFADHDGLLANHPRHLQQLASGKFYTQPGSGIIIQLGDIRGGDIRGNDAGASDSFATAGGTYSVGYGDYTGNLPAPALAPRAKIINVATMPDPCAYESGVCVIRP